ncbi:F-box only protein 21-like [Mya arenaria]|uniref:F-box only protein 21-like n=1 Tax=Mya arenaria TaxID=6604 RepID=UPI0022E9150B|nr:F-box only protein 21-like [Mya arenaria]
MEKENEDFPPIMNMPAEVIEHIMTNECISYNDVLNMAKTCCKMNDICQSNDIWKTKIRQRWPKMLNWYDRKISYIWKEEFYQRHTFGDKVEQLLKTMSPKFYQKEELSKEDFDELTKLSEQHDHAAECLVDELLSVLHDKNPNEELTSKYYAQKAARHVQHLLLTKKIKAYVEKLSAEQMLEIGATLFAQWFQPSERVTETEVADMLDRLADETRRVLASAEPNHPALGATLDPIDIHKELWSCAQSRAILEAINVVLYIKNEFKGNKFRNYAVENSYINKVFETKRGIPITLCIIYAGIARRLGVICEPVNAPYHFLLRWRQHPLSSGDHVYAYIDAFNSGKLLQIDEVSSHLQIERGLISSETMVYATPCHVLEREVRNLVHVGHELSMRGDYALLRDALEISVLMQGHNVESRMLLARINLHLNINLDDVLESLDYITTVDQTRIGLVAHLTLAARQKKADNEREGDTQKKVKLRKTEVEFSVGMVMKHKRYSYSCVISGWDERSKASREWNTQMGVYNLPLKDKQPFYNVLVEDGSNRYAAQENLDYHESPCLISHPDVGKYFERFDGRKYIPNAEKAEEYPDDTEVTANLIGKHYQT